jgi:hypothetical protein
MKIMYIFSQQGKRVRFHLTSVRIKKTIPASTKKFWQGCGCRVEKDVLPNAGGNVN